MSTSLFLDSLQYSLNLIDCNPRTLIVLLGDFNAHFDVNDPSTNSEFGIRFQLLLERNNLFQLISEPTCVTNRSASILDFIITNAPGYFVSTGTDSPPSNCDHCFIFGKLSISLVKPKAFKRFIWNFQTVNVNDLNADFSQANWQDSLCDINNIDLSYDRWFSLFKHIIEKHIPNKLVTIRPRDNLV